MSADLRKERPKIYGRTLTFENNKSYSMKENESYLVADWTVQPHLNLLTNRQSELVLQPRLMRLLEYFLQHQNEIVTKDELLDYVWEERLVTENLLTKSISELRKILKTHFNDSIEIETLRNVGYRLNLTDSKQEKTTTPHLEKSQPTTTKKWWYVAMISIAVLVLLLRSNWTTQPTKNWQLKHSKITSLAGMEMSPAISPNGRNIAFGWRKNPQTKSQIYVRALSENAPRQISQNEQLNYCPLWSADGDYLLYFRQLATQEYAIVQHSLVGAEERILTTLPFFAVDQLRWLIAGKRLVFVVRKTEDTPRALFTFDVTTLAVAQLTHPPADSYGDIFPTNTNQADKVAFIRAQFGKSLFSNAAPINGELIELNINTLATKTLTVIPSEINSFLYHPHLERYLLWTTEQLGDYPILGIDKNGQQHEIGRGQLGFPRHAATLNENGICYEYWRSNADILSLNISDTAIQNNLQKYLHSTSWDWGISTAKQTDKAAFFSQRSGYTEIWLTDINAPENARQITHLESALLKSLAISPNGKRLVFNQVKNNQAQLFSMLTNGKQLTAITEVGNYGTAEWAVDGASLYYSVNMAGKWRIFQYDFSTQIATLLPIPDGFRVLPSVVDNDILYFVKYHTDGLWAYRKSTQQSHLIAPLEEVKHSVNWVVSPQGVYYLNWKNSVSQVIFYDFKTQQNRTIQSLDKTLIGIPSLAISRDFTTLYLTQGTGLGSDILAIEFEQD